MENHPLLKELLNFCSTHNLDTSKAHLVFESYIELIEVQKFFTLNYHYNEILKMFYFIGQKEKSNSKPEIYIPILSHEQLSPEDIDNWMKILNTDNEKLNFLIRERDSSSVCYQITKGLIKPDSPLETIDKKNCEYKKNQLNNFIYTNRKQIYTKALKES
uniref:tRNA-splicing endonuclease subunit Sen15 domain-containing protein n=1 Tax=Pediculus humanus subsp. corporis TaxID=121224 RepID=A0A1S4MYX3_PEDHC